MIDEVNQSRDEFSLLWLPCYLQANGLAIRSPQKGIKEDDMKKQFATLVFIFIFSASIVAGGMSTCYAKELPKVISITCFKVGSLGFTITSAFREVVERNTPMKMRVEPHGTEVSRILPLRNGEAELTIITGPNAVSASYGFGEFGTEKWGPQPLRIVWRGMTAIMGSFVHADSDIHSLKDLKGKRIPTLPGSPTANINITSHLAFGGLTWDDVTPVVCTSPSSSLDTFLAGKIDMGFLSPSVPKLQEVFAARRGARWLPMPHADKDAWKRLHAIAPWNIPAIYKRGVGLKEGEVIEMGSFSLSIYAYDKADFDVIYAFVKAMAEGYEIYSPMHKVLPLWTLKQAVTDPCALPYHEAAIKYYKEAGVWTAEMDERQAVELKNFEKRLEAWKKKK